MKPKFLYSESKLSEVTGLSRTVLKGCRIKGEWKSGKGKGRPVVLSQKAVDVVLERFGIKDTNLDGATLGLGRDTQPAPNQGNSTITVPRGATPNPLILEPPRHATGSEKAGTLVQDGVMLKLLHVSQIVPNKRILRAKNGTGEIYQVIVPSNLVFAIGDPLRAKQSERHNGYFELVGKAPRWRGDRIYRHEFAQSL